LEETGSITVKLTRKGARGLVSGQGAQTAPVVITGKISGK